MPASGPRSGAGRRVDDMPAPERHLTRFVRTVAFLERASNAIGTAAFMWATAVLLGGFSTLLNQRDFLYAAFLVFLEAARIFSQNTRMEYQFFFRARGALRRPRLNRLIAIACMAEVLVFIMAKYENEDTLPILGPFWKAGNFQEQLTNDLQGYCEKHIRDCTDFGQNFFQVFVTCFAVTLFTLGKLMYPVVLNLFCDPQHRPGSLWSSLAAILLLSPCLFLETSIPKHMLKVPRIIFIPLLVAVLLVATSRLQFQRITALVNSPTGRRIISRSPVIMIFCVCTAVVILGSMAGALLSNFLLLALLAETFGNLEVLAAAARIRLAVLGITEVRYLYPHSTLESTKNFMDSRTIFYRMVLIEGTLCILACILETFSSIPRKSLLHQSGFGSKWGVKCVDMYYSRVYEQCIAGGVLAPKITQLTIFAMDFTNSDSASNQLYGVQMLHSFLQKEPSKTLLLSRLSTSMKTVQTLISMLGWASPQNAAIRLFAAKVINDIANTLQVVAIPGSMQNISSLLGTDNQMKRQSPLLYTYGSREERQDTVLDISDDEEDKQDPLVQTSSRRNFRMRRSPQWMTTCCSIEEELFTDQDLLPVLGMSILERLADCGPENCEEICRVNNLIPKIIEYTNEIHDKILKGSSLKLLRRLSITGGEIGITLRNKISEQPCLLTNLAEILDDIESSQELKKLATEILRNLATDRNTRKEIVHIGVITSRLIHAFLAGHPPSNPYSDRSLQIAAGQALALLAMESVNDSSLMLKEPGYVFIRELIVMIQDDRYNRYVAASILRNLCQNGRPMLSSSHMVELSYFLRKVLERIMNTEEAGELEVLISLSSQICIIIAGDFARELERGQIKDRFVKKLVKALKANMKPTVHFPGIRRAIIEQVICMMELENSSSYANYFSECRMMEALSMVENTASKIENYMLFFGNAGLMEHSIPLSDLVARAKKELIQRAA